jgi:fucose permease
MNTKSSSTVGRPGRRVGLIFLAYIAFISLGMPDGLLGVAWPGIRETFGLPIDALGLMLVFGTAGYMTSSFFSGTLVRRLGVGGLLALSVAATSVTLLVYALSPWWGLFFAVAALGGLGAGAIDAGLNTYVAQNHGEHTMQWLHASFGIGITMGPFIMTAAITSSGRWQPGYFIVSGAQGLLALAFFLTRRLWKDGGSQLHEDQKPENQARILETLQQIPALLSMLMFFIYTGVELGLGLWAYSLLTESRGVDPAVAGVITGSYWGMFTIGRIVAGLYAQKIRVKALIIGSVLLAAIGSGLLLLNLGPAISVAGIALTGFAIAPIFPGLVSDTHNRVGLRHQANTIGMQISAAGFGAAVIPSLAGVLARYFTLEVIPLYLLSGLVLLLVSFILSHPRNLRNTQAS